MSTYTSLFSFSSPFHLTTLANFNKYTPVNTLSTQVLSSDVIARHVDGEGVLHTERLLVCKQNVPSLLRRFVAIPDTAYFHEFSTLNPVTQEYKATSVNLSLRSVLQVFETCQFKTDPASPTQNTLFQQDVRISAFGGLGVEKLIESAAIKRFRDNAGKGREGLQLVVDSFKQELDQKMEAGLASGKQALRDLDERVDVLGTRIQEGVQDVKDSWKAFESKWQSRGLSLSLFQ